MKEIRNIIILGFLGWVAGLILIKIIMFKFVDGATPEINNRKCVKSYSIKYGLLGNIVEVECQN